MTEARPAFYALAPGGWRDYVTLLHPPYTLWHLSYVAIGAAIAPHFDAGIMSLTLVGFFLAILVTHALSSEGIVFAVPYLSLVYFVIAAIIVGILAAIWPARRAAKLNVLEALQYE